MKPHGRLSQILLTGFALLTLSSAASAQLIISEFRVRGPSGANDEFIEIYNNSGADHTVAGGGTGYGVASSDGVARCVIPNGTVIPNRGHYLCVNSVAYSLASYPAGNGTTATGDATYVTDIPDNAGIAIFNTSVGANFLLANRLDAVGSTSEANTLYKEGTGYPALTPFSIDYAFYRDSCGKAGSITTFGPCSISTPGDTNNNAADFIFVDTNGTSAGAGQRLGAPGPENLSAPIASTAPLAPNLLDATVASTSPPNRVRDFTSDPPNNSTFGTLDIRQRFVNTSGGNLTRLRFRIIDLTTFPAPSGIADTRPRTSTSVVVAGVNDAATCAATGVPATPPCTVTVQGTTLEQPPSQPNGGGFNSSMSAGTVTLGTPLANGASINLRFLLGLQQTGCFKFGITADVLPGGAFSVPQVIEGTTDGGCTPAVTIEQAGAQADPTGVSPINFTATFSEAVTGFATGDVTLTGTAGATTATVTGGPIVFNVAVSGMIGNGTVIASIPAGVATSSALGISSAASTSVDNTVTFILDAIPPTVTIDQAGGQADPTNASPINFTVVFSESVANFATGDVTLAGTAGATTATVSGSGTTYNVAVSGMVGPGTVIASLAAGVASDAATNPSAASTSTDNTVTFDNVAPTVTIEQAVGQADPAAGEPINFTVTFSEPVAGFATGDVTLAGTAGATTATVSGGPTVFNVAVTGLTQNGTVTASIAAAVATDLAGNPNTASTSADNSVTAVFAAFLPHVPVPTLSPALLAVLALTIIGFAAIARRRGQARS